MKRRPRWNWVASISMPATAVSSGADSTNCSRPTSSIRWTSRSSSSREGARPVCPSGSSAADGTSPTRYRSKACMSPSSAADGSISSTNQHPPFNIVPPFTNGDVTCQAIGCPPIEIPVERLEPSARWGNAQGGARFNATTGTVDWSLSTYRGFESFGLYRLQLGPPGSALPRSANDRRAELSSFHPGRWRL